MRAERFGSYSIVDTVAGMSRLSRLKSMMRYIRLWPPPRHDDVSCPRLLRPPDSCSGSTSGWYGSWAVISSNTCTVWHRLPGDVGLYLRIGMGVSLNVRSLKFEVTEHFHTSYFVLSTLLPRTPASSRLRGASRTPSSSPGGGRRSVPGASPCRARCSSGC